MEETYRNATVLITGASMGLGRALALRLAPFSTNLILCARSLHLLESLRDECLRLGARKVAVFACDVSDIDQCGHVVQCGLQQVGVDHLDVLLLNAGVSGSIEFASMSTEQVRSLFPKMWQVNFMGYVNFVHFCLPYLLKKNRKENDNDGRSRPSSIGVISSMSGLIGVPYRTAYCSSKYAVNGFFEVLRNELNAKQRSFAPNDPSAPRRVNITVAMPGWIDTGLRDRHLVEAHKDQYAGSGADPSVSSSAPQHKKDDSKVMTVDQCVHDVLNAISCGKREERFILKQKIVPLLKAISPETVDSMISKHVNATPTAPQQQQQQIASKL